MANEPSLSEITNINVNPIIGGGESTPVIDNTKIVDTLSQAARYHAENSWRKYKQFLENKSELFKNISEIQGLETAQQDRDLLKGQAAEILGDITKDPSIVMGGNGYSELQGKIAKFKADAMTSKQDKVDDELNAKFMGTNPELMTEDNTAMRENFWKAPLGARKPVMLKMPTIFDEKTAVEGLIKNSATEYDQVVGKDGKPGGEGYIAKIAEFDPEKFNVGWNMIVKGGQQDKYAHDLKLAVEERYRKLPEREKAKYDAEGGGGIEKFWADKGDQYLKAYFPDGKYRIIKDIHADPNYLGKERLAMQQKQLDEEIKNNKVLRAQGWARIGIEEAKLKKADTEDSAGALSVINEAASIINNATPIDVVVSKTPSGTVGKKTLLRISDPTLLQKFGNIDKDNKLVNVPDAINFDPETNQPSLLYYKKQSQEDKLAGKIQTENFKYEREIPLDQRTWLKLITQRSFPNKDIGEINNLVEKALLQNNNSIYEIAQRLKNQNQQAQAPAQTPNTKTFEIKGKKYTMDELHKFGYTDEQINSAFKSGKIK